MQYFDAGCYRGYGDDPKGFYAVYRRLFGQIEEFENDHLGDEDLEYDAYAHTSFGSRDTAYDPAVARFYERWVPFASQRPFLEVQAYDVEHAENRRVRRAMEKENQRRRDAMRAEFSDTVRSLAAFVRKRDPRYKQYLAERQAERERAERARKVAVKDKRQAEMEGFVEADWARKDLEDLHSAAREFFPKTTGEGGGSEGSEEECEDDDEEEEDDDDDDATEDAAWNEFYCAPCKKLFKNQLQWKNHEQSKKHKDQLRKMGIRKPRRNWSDESEPDDDEEEGLEEKEQEGQQSEETSSSSVHDAGPPSRRASTASSLDIGSDAEVEDLEALLAKLNASGRKKAADAAEHQQKPPVTKKAKRNKANNPAKADEGLKCGVCGAAFPTRNRLFRHIEEEGHAMPPKASSKKKK
jgi:DnaJ family protein A protein 5